MSLECEPLLACLGIPDHYLRGVLPLRVRSSTGDPFPVGAETHAQENDECPSNVSISLKNNLTGVFATLADEDHVKKSKIMQE